MGRVGPLELLLERVALPIVSVLVALAWIGAIVGFVRFRARRRREREAVGHRALEAPHPEVRVVEREKIVERQVLVMRCRFCNKLTPVDGTACAECGAHL